LVHEGSVDQINRKNRQAFGAGIDTKSVAVNAAGIGDAGRSICGALDFLERGDWLGFAIFQDLEVILGYARGVGT